MIILHRHEPEQHIDRWYCVDLVHDLFGNLALYRSWGSLRTTYQHVRCDLHPTEAAAVQAAQQIVNRRIRHGYRAVFDDRSFDAGVDAGNDLRPTAESQWRHDAPPVAASFCGNTKQVQSGP
jgi:predicted DNA-binding WGR domain protein